MNRTLILASILPVALLGACATSTHPVVPAATPAQQAVLLDKMKTLEGEWTMPDEKGVIQMASVFRVTAAGSAVREVMFPGTPHEMTNMYHMDGPTMVMTHYCAIGNQPSMRAQPGDGKTVEFVPDSVWNLTSKDGGYMGGLKVTFVDNDHVLFSWTHYKDGVPQDAGGHNPVFTLTRKK